MSNGELLVSNKDDLLPKPIKNRKFSLKYRIFICHIQSANDVNIFIILCESPLKVRNIAVYQFLISLLVPELLRFNDLKNDKKLLNLVKSIKGSGTDIITMTTNLFQTPFA